MYTKDEFIHYFKTKYPDYDLDNNMLFKTTELFFKLTIDEFTNLIIELESSKQWNLVMNLFEYGNTKVVKDMMLYIAKKSPKRLNEIFPDNIDIDEKKIFEIYEELYDYSKEVNIEELQFDEINIYDYILDTRKKYKEHNLNENDRNLFYDKLYNYINHQLKDIADSKVINEIVGYILSGEIDIFKLYRLYEHKIEDYLGYGKFGIDNVNRINVETLSIVKKSYLDSLINILSSNNINISDFTKNSLIKMIAVLGYENAKKVILYNRNIEKVLRSFNMIELDNYDNVIKESFVNLYLGKNLNDPNNLLNTIYGDSDNLIRKNFGFVFNSWEAIEVRYYNQKLDTKTSFIYKLLSDSKYILNPDEFKIEGNILNICIDNKQYVHTSTQSVVDRLRELYKAMIHNYKKKIPYVNGKYEEYSYETICADDPTLFELGSDTNCCFKICGDADSFVEYCVEDENNRVLVIRDRNKKICAMAPMIRNGNLVIVNSIESKDISDFDFMKKMFHILEIVGNEFINISSNEESADEKISAVVISNYKNQIEKFLNLELVKNLNYNKLSPLKGNVYSDMGGFDWSVFFVSKCSDYSPNKINSFEAFHSYLDPRPEELELEEEDISDNVKNIINGICFEKYGNYVDFSNVYRISLNKDWYIILNKDYTIESAIVGKDRRAYEEYKEYLSLVIEFSNECKKEHYIMV